jgi:hypothetical protein
LISDQPWIKRSQGFQSFLKKAQATQGPTLTNLCLGGQTAHGVELIILVVARHRRWRRRCRPVGLLLLIWGFLLANFYGWPAAEWRPISGISRFQQIPASRDSQPRSISPSHSPRVSIVLCLLPVPVNWCRVGRSGAGGTGS